jgi:hypothetical protein
MARALLGSRRCDWQKKNMYSPIAKSFLMHIGAWRVVLWGIKTHLQFTKPFTVYSFATRPQFFRTIYLWLKGLGYQSQDYRLELVRPPWINLCQPLIIMTAVPRLIVSWHMDYYPVTQYGMSVLSKRWYFWFYRRKAFWTKEATSKNL